MPAVTVPVVVADDSRTILELILLTLSRGGIETASAGDGAEALERIREHRPRLVILDAMMPNGDGIEPEFVPSLFDRFQRSDAARQSGTGAGLGLSIARLYARAHGGDLVYKEDAVGTRFDLVLPT